MEEYLYKDECYQIVGAAMEVHKELKDGFLEAVYQEALSIEMSIKGILYEREKQLNILYKGIKLQKTYIADFFCFGKIIVEVKATTSMSDEHIAQLLNYMSATNTKVGLLINFGERSLKYKRLIL